MAEDEEKDWLQDFVGIMSGASDVVRNVTDAIGSLRHRSDPSPMTVPVAMAQAQEAHDVQGEQRTGGPGEIDLGTWLPVLAVLVVLILLVKA